MNVENIKMNTENIKELDLKELKASLPESIIEENFWLGRETTYRAGGRAALHIKLGSFQDFQSFVELAPKIELPFLVFGKGSNLLIAERGFPRHCYFSGSSF